MSSYKLVHSTKQFTKRIDNVSLFTVFQTILHFQDNVSKLIKLCHFRKLPKLPLGGIWKSLN